jgi:predicted nucleic acid-binding protein
MPNDNERNEADPIPDVQPLEERKSPWNSLEAAKLIVAALIPISVFLAGVFISQAAKKHDEATAQMNAISQLSRSALERRSRSELLASAMRRHAEAPIAESLAEVQVRKLAYETAYVEWNANLDRHMLTLRHASNASEYSTLEGHLQHSLVNQVFKPLDACLTDAFDKTIRKMEKEAGEALKACGVSKLLEWSLTCTYDISYVAYQAVRNASKKDAASPANAFRCPAPKKEANPKSA